MALRLSYVDTAGGQVHLRSLAGSGTPVAFFHQTASSGRMWEKVMSRMTGGRPMHAFDTPGFGGSFDPPADSRPTMSVYVDWLHEAVVGAAGNRVHLVGHHTGACIAVELAARYPELAASLTLIGPVPLTPEERAEFARHFGLPFTPTVSGGYLLDNWQYLRDLGAAADVDLMHREMVDMLRAWTGRVQSYAAVWDQDFTGFYRQVACPLLVMAAADDVLYPFLERATALRPDAATHPVEGANFEPDLDAATVAEALAAFIGRSEARPG